MKIIYKKEKLAKLINNEKNLGFVPTMGCIHKAHLSLIKKSNKISRKTIVSIFVNRPQFNKKIDYQKYPKTIKKDIKILRRLNVDFLYIPFEKDIYPKGPTKNIKISSFSKQLCGKFRPGHFEAVVDVINRFIKIIKPKNIFMGEKDFQQLYLVKRYIRKKYNSKIIQCKTIRDKNKLALSSRNLLLNKKELSKAGKIAKNMILFKKKLSIKKDIKKSLLTKKDELNKSFNIEIEYLEIRNKHNLRITNKILNSKIFIAYYINKVRLIDNF